MSLWDRLEPSYQSLSERLRQGHEEWLARGGDPDGVNLDGGSSKGESVPLPDLSYPPYEDESDDDRESRWNRIGGDIGTPVPEYPELPPYKP